MSDTPPVISLPANEWVGNTNLVKTSDYRHLINTSATAAKAFRALLDDMNNRAEMLAGYTGKPVELPVGNGVLFNARKAIIEIEKLLA